MEKIECVPVLGLVGTVLLDVVPYKGSNQGWNECLEGFVNGAVTLSYVKPSMYLLEDDAHV